MLPMLVVPSDFLSNPLPSLTMPLIVPDPEDEGSISPKRVNGQ